MTDLWLIRHGRPAEETRGRCYGSLDVSLASDSLSTLADTVNKLPRLDALYCSPRQRCVQTAALIASNYAVIQNLRELDFGKFEGRRYDEIAATDPGIYQAWMTDPSTVTFPDGESFAILRERVLPCVHALLTKHEGQRLGIVSHGGVNRIVIAHALGIPDKNIFHIGQDYGALNLIRYYGEYPVLELLNAQ